MWRANAPSGAGMKERVFPLLLCAALCFISSPPALAQCTADSYEEDDACIPSDAVIHGGDTQSHNFCTDVEDFLSFNACTGRSYTIDATGIVRGCLHLTTEERDFLQASTGRLRRTARTTSRCCSSTARSGTIASTTLR
jgi:hypothetical protein